MNDQCGCVREPGCRLTGKNDWWTAESDWRPWVITLDSTSVITQRASDGAGEQASERVSATE